MRFIPAITRASPDGSFQFSENTHDGVSFLKTENCEIGCAMATLVQAIRLALHYGETHLGVTDIFGEDVGPPLGGVFTATQGLKTAWNSMVLTLSTC
jgi:hypothetical protein